MNRRILLVGSGGREHALAASLALSRRTETLWVAPGNAGTAEWNVALDVEDHDAVLRFCRRMSADLVVVGPEGPLVGGLADVLTAEGIAVFGPTAAAARLEGSKDFTREFAARHGIPSPRHATFTDAEAAIAHARGCGYPVVVKADGLAAGKGVFVPRDGAETNEAIRLLLEEQRLGEAGSRVVLEERLEGTEVSLFGICDGDHVVILPPAQDHKRLLDGDLGPNTGGMGAFAPTPVLRPEELAPLAETFLQRAVDGSRADGTPYVGVLYAGLMLTGAGPRLLEYNCRFGDPEAQVLLPLLASDPVDLFEAAVQGRLDEIEVRVRPGAAATVVVASEGYPDDPITGREVRDLEAAGEVATVFHAGTRREKDRVVSAGGRVLAVTGVGGDLDEALNAAYAGAARVRLHGSRYRRDIGAAHRRQPPDEVAARAYATAGVDLAAGAEAVAALTDAVTSTHDERVLRGVGAFGGAFSARELAGMSSPTLVASTDGVGTKTLLASEVDRWEGIGIDVVNHGVNDVLVQGARPLFFLDSIACGALSPKVVGRIVSGMAEACREAGCVLLGGETAELPDLLVDDAVDVNGTLVGVVEGDRLLPRSPRSGDLLVGLGSSGLHTNGYTLARRVVADRSLHDLLPGGTGESLADALLAPHRSYLPVLTPVLDAGLVEALVHVTGGGLVDNVPRALPAGRGAVIDVSTWPTPPLFEWLVAETGMAVEEAHRTLNMGVGMVAVVADDRLEEFLDRIEEPAWVIGEITDRPGVFFQ